MNKTHTLAALALLPVALLTLNSCTTVPAEHTSAVHRTGTSTTYVDVIKVTASVTAIDASTRKLKLTLTDGERISVKCGPEVLNFNQIHIHDHVKVTMTGVTAIYLDKGKPLGISGSTKVAFAPAGAKPGTAIVETVQATVKITGIDTKTRHVTFTTKNGTTTTVRAGDHVDFKKVKVGDHVTVRQTESAAISVEKP